MLIETCFSTGRNVINFVETPAAGIPLVLLHGATRWWQDWQPLMPHLAPDWHVYACDLRGHGKSDWEGDRYQLSDYSSDITAFLHGEVGEPAVLMGHSLGALVALATATQSPESVRALVLLDPPIYLHNSSINAMPDTRFWLNLLYEMTASVQTYAEMLDICHRMMAGRGHNEDEIKTAADNFYGIAPEAIRVAMEDRLLDDFDIASALECLTCPLIVIHGDGHSGSVVRDEDAYFIRQHCPHAVIVKIPGAGHQIQAEHVGTVVAQTQNLLPLLRLYQP